MAAESFDSRLDRLLATAAKVFADKGFHPTTMRDLSRETGMSLAGIYYYVESKDELLYLIQHQCFTAVLRGAEAAVASATDPLDRLQAFIRHHLLFFTSHMNEMKVLSHESESLSAERKAGIVALKRRYTDLLIRLLEDLDNGEEQVEPALAAYALFGMTNWIYTWYDPAGPTSPEKLAREFTRLILNGVLQSTPTSVAHGG